MSKEAMKLALDYILAINQRSEFWLVPGSNLNKTVTALREALTEQPTQQEPFGYFRYDLRLDAWVQNRAGITGTAFYTSPPAQRNPLTDEQQIAEALRRQGLTLVKTAKGYDVINLGQITAHGIKGDA